MEESWQRPLTWSHSSQLLGVNTFEASPDEGKIEAGKPYAYYWLVNKIEFRVTFSLSNSWNMGFFWYLPCHQSGFDAQKFLLVPSPVWCICIYIYCAHVGGPKQCHSGALAEAGGNHHRPLGSLCSLSFQPQCTWVLRCAWDSFF